MPLMLKTSTAVTLDIFPGQPHRGIGQPQSSNQSEKSTVHGANRVCLRGRLHESSTSWPRPMASCRIPSRRECRHFSMVHCCRSSPYNRAPAKPSGKGYGLHSVQVSIPVPETTPGKRLSSGWSNSPPHWILEGDREHGLNTPWFYLRKIFPLGLLTRQIWTMQVVVNVEGALSAPPLQRQR